MSFRALLSNALRITWKDLVDLERNRLGLVLLVAMPLFMLGLVGLVYPRSGATLSNATVALVNEDSGYQNSTIASQTFISALQQMNKGSNIMKLSNMSTVADAKNAIQNGSMEAAIVIPSNFTSSLKDGKQGIVIIMTDESNPQLSATIDSVLSGMLSEVGTLVAQRTVQSLNPSIVNTTNSLAIIQPFKLQIQGIVSGSYNYFEFVAPGIMMLSTMMSVMTGLPSAVSREKELGTMDGIMVSPISRLSIIIGKTLSQTARGMIQAIIIMAMAVTVFGVSIEGNILLVFALLLLGVFSFVGVGIMITSFSSDQQTATMLMMTLTFPMMFLSGIFFPIQQMPWYMQDISKVIPLTYAADALRRVMVLGAWIPDISTDIIVLILFGIFTTAIALPVFDREMTV